MIGTVSNIGILSIVGTIGNCGNCGNPDNSYPVTSVTTLLTKPPITPPVDGRFAAVLSRFLSFGGFPRALPDGPWCSLWVTSQYPNPTPPPCPGVMGHSSWGFAHKHPECLFFRPFGHRPACSKVPPCLRKQATKKPR